MERVITSMDQHGRMLIPSSVREKFNIQPGEKVAMEIDENEIRIISADYVIDEMYKIFTKNQTGEKISIVNDFNDKKHQEYLIEESRSKKNV